MLNRPFTKKNRQSGEISAAPENVVGLGEMKLSQDPGATLVTHALGSCLGVAAYDPVARVGALFHPMLPTAGPEDRESPRRKWMFVDVGVPLMLEALERAGAERGRLNLKAAGAAHSSNETDCMQIGRRNWAALRKILWQERLLLNAYDVGGSIPRTLYLQLASGHCWIQSQGRSWDL